ncbi:MAG: PTS glucose transporter subunit IIA, partial [Beduini sp.]
GLELDDGTGVLIHCGIDTVNMQGEGFKCNVEANQEVQAGDLLLTFNLELVKSKGYSTQTMVIFTEVPNERQVVMQKDQQYIAVIK